MSDNIDALMEVIIQEPYANFDWWNAPSRKEVPASPLGQHPTQYCNTMFRMRGGIILAHLVWWSDDEAMSTDTHDRLMKVYSKEAEIEDTLRLLQAAGRDVNIAIYTATQQPRGNHELCYGDVQLR